MIIFANASCPATSVFQEESALLAGQQRGPQHHSPGAGGRRIWLLPAFLGDV